ncbi:MAG: transcription antitermination factor NusB [Rhodospirillaceae bacterium]|jgi:N utilization substance protein B|nr:transcription antitermination factor NusB [Rhodospirillaceae bacterium]
MTKKSIKGRSVARLAAVQALYYIEFSDCDSDRVIVDFLQYHMCTNTLLMSLDGKDNIKHGLIKPDPTLFKAIFLGTLAKCDVYDSLIDDALIGGWTVKRLEFLLHVILRAGTCELSDFPDMPKNVIISEYVDLTYAFYGGPEPGLVNAVLDRICLVLRSEISDVKN